MLKKYRILLTMIFCILIYLILSPGTLPVPAEEIDIPAGIAIDLEVGPEENKQYRVTLNVYTFAKKDEIGSLIIGGIGSNIPETRDQRQLRSNHKFLYGLEKAIIFSEAIARSGMTQTMDMLFSNQFISDMGWMVVCKGKASDILSTKVDDYATSADYIEGMIKHSNEQNFFSDNYKILDAYVRMDAEGRSLVLPYIEIKNNQIQISGTALFKKDKMVQLLDMEDTRTMNLLREKNARGILVIEEGFNKLTAMNGKTKKKVNCERISDAQLKFTIDLVITGDVMTNNIYDDFLSKPEVINDFKAALENQTKKECLEFIDKMQNELKIDCLDLGLVAAAKFGRGTGADWDRIVSESEIEVNVKVKVDRFGRGLYTVKAE